MGRIQVIIGLIYHAPHNYVFMTVTLGVSIVMGGIQEWWVYEGKSHERIDDDWGYPHDLGKHHMFILWSLSLSQIRI